MCASCSSLADGMGNSHLPEAHAAVPGAVAKPASRAALGAPVIAGAAKTPEALLEHRN